MFCHMEAVIMVAVSENGVIGKGGRIPWHIPEDLQRFRALTMGHPVVMGRTTYETIIPEEFRPLPGRHNIVLTKNRKWKPGDPGVTAVGSLEEALHVDPSLMHPQINYEVVFVIGGASVYREALPKVNRVELTRVHQVIDCYVYFPHIY